MRIFADMSSVLWTNLLRGEDAGYVEVEHNSKVVKVNSVAHGYENAVSLIEMVLEMFDAAPRDLVMVFEGRDSKRRRCRFDPQYKANREGSNDSRPELAYQHFQELRDLLRNTYKDLGAISVTQNYVEGDDIIAYLAQNTEEDAVILTNDQDLTVLMGDNDYGANISIYAGGELNLNKFGDFHPRLITLYKALVGDASDNVKGVPRFGPKTWLNLNATYQDEGCFELMSLVEDGNVDEIAAIARENNCKMLEAIALNFEAAFRSYKLVKLYPNWVDTNTNPLVWDAGMVKDNTNDERLQKWKAASVLVTALNYDKALQRLQQQLKVSPYVGFDIETSTPDESDEWLEAAGDSKGVDVMGSELTGFTLNFGKNMQYSMYVSVDHYDTPNVTMKQAREMIEACFGLGMVMHNSSFELSVLYANCKDEDGWWRDLWVDEGEFGMLPHMRDTMLESSYVDENRPLGLKFRSKHHLGYDQASYDDTTLLEERLYPGGVEEKGKWRYKMRELPAKAVAAYGNDDGVVTSALHNLYKLRMGLEHHYKVYLDVEINAAYLHAKSFTDGVRLDMAKLRELEKEDSETYDKAWAILREYLMENGWEGTVPPVYQEGITAKEIKEAYVIVSGVDPEAEDDNSVLKSRVRTPSKLAALISAEGEEELAALILSEDYAALTRYVQSRFDGEPKFKFSNKQMVQLMYEVMGLPVKLRNKPTEKMISEGIMVGNPKADDLAIQYALIDAPSEEIRDVLNAIKTMRMVETRRSLYYNTYPYLVHWKTGKIHASHRQCGTNTRRASSSNPNLQQLSKHEKVEGQPPRVREMLLPNDKDSVVVSMDFSGQEMRVIADYSKDNNLVACFVGDNLKDIHSLTGAGIFRRKEPEMYKAVASQFVEADEYLTFMYLKDGDEHQKQVYGTIRSLGKVTNFSTEYGAQAPKLAATLLVSVDEAETYIQAREAAFPQVSQWKLDVQAAAKRDGYVTTMLGARRHLAEAFASEDRYISSKAERQAVNFKVQGSSAEMTKLAEGRMWRSGIFAGKDNTYIHPVHDEVVASVKIADLPQVLPRMHEMMVAPYASMEIPIESEVSIGKNFGEQIEVGKVVTEEGISNALKELV